MTARFRRWLAVVLAGAAPSWPAAAPGQSGAPIPLLPPVVTTPRAAPSPQAPAAPYQAPGAPYRLPPPTPYPAPSYQAAPPTQYAPPPTPYEAAPAAPYQAPPPTPYQEAPAAPPPKQQTPIVITPLTPQSPPPLSNSPAASATPEAPAPPASGPGAPASAASGPAAPAPTDSNPATPAPAPGPEAPAQAVQTPPPEEPAGPQPAPPPYPNEWVPQKAARLVVLDKLDSLSKDLTVAVGESASYGPLTITVQSCMVRPPNQPANATAFLVISDSHKDEPGFRGWTLANDPWLSMLQNPVYDVWIMGCQQ